jgi:hypothetical protein
MNKKLAEKFKQKTIELSVLYNLILMQPLVIERWLLG